MWRRFLFLISFVCVLVLYSSASADLVARYTFDNGTATDSAYYYADADGTFFGDAEVVDDPCRGPVLDLDGSGDYVKVLNSEVANFSTESFTFSFWTQCSTLSAWYYFWRGTMFDENLKGANCYHDNDSGEVRFTLYNYPEAGKVRVNAPDANFVTGKWIHIACVRDADADELRLYVNGELEPPAGDSSNPQEDTVKNISNTGQLYIGANDRTGPSDFFYGRIDDFRVYNNALSQQDVQRLAADYQDPNLASDPLPQHGNQNVCPDIELSWTPGVNADSHDVYFGTSYSSVMDANTSDLDVYRGNQGPNTYDAGSLEILVPGQSYFWRIDEVSNANPDNPWKGDVWTFGINDGKANSPDPADESKLVPLEQILTWNAGCFADSHDVYFGTDLEDVNNATTSVPLGVYKDNQLIGDTDYNPGGLDFSTDYYWRIDEVNEPNLWKGNVWHFRSKSSIVDPNLRAWYKLDEPEGTIAYDSSGREFNAYVYGDGVWEPENGHNDGCFFFDDNANIEIPMDVYGDVNEGITIAAWLNSGVARSHDNVVCGAGWDDFRIRAAVPDDDHEVTWRAGDEVNDVMYWDAGNPQTWQDSWNHFAFVKDEHTGKMEIYLNGLKVDEKTGASEGTLAKLHNTKFRIGAAFDNMNDYIGRIDDFQVYDRALTAQEISAIFRGGDVEFAWGPEPYDGEPYDGQADVPRDANLIWRPGDYAVQHDVYFGTNFDDVNDANTTSDGYIDRFDFDANTYNPPNDLVLEKTYYWRIDEVNDFDPNIWKGAVWTFTVANFLVIDDFESYGPTSNFITDTWIDGGGGMAGNLSGCLLNIGMNQFNNPVHTGDKSMDYGYNCDAFDWINFKSVYYSEAELPFDSPQDWTEAGVKILTLFFYGEKDNDANDTEQMYVAVKDSNDNCAEIRYGDAGEDMNDIMLEEWQELNIALSDFHDANQVDANYVTNLYIGFGHKAGEVAGGSGKVYFDDIRLYLPKCVPVYGPQYDFSDNCIIDYADLAIMADQWLRTDANLPASQPAVGPIGHWELDGDATDSSGNLYHGTAEGNYSWTTGHIGTGAINFQSGRVRVTDVAALRPTDQVSATAWLKYSEKQNAGRVVVKGADNKETYEIEVGDEDQLIFQVRDGNDPGLDSYPRYSAESDKDQLYRDEWTHAAGTYDGNTVKCYINGQLAGTNEDANQIVILSQDTSGLAIGNRSDADDKPFVGSIDDVLVYDYALTPAEIAYVATAPNNDGYFPLTTEVNIYHEPANEEVVNFRDLAKLIDKWLYKKYWP